MTFQLFRGYDIMHAAYVTVFVGVNAYCIMVPGDIKLSIIHHSSLTPLVLDVTCPYQGQICDIEYMVIVLSSNQRIASSVLKGYKWGFEIRGLKANNCVVYQ